MESRPCIRDAVDSDLGAFSRLHALVESMHRRALPGRFRKPPASYAAKVFREALRGKDCRLFVAESDGRVAGYAVVRIKRAPKHPLLKPGKQISLEEMSVARDARRSGIGSALVRHAERFAAKKGFAELELHVYAFNAGARSFYERLGYPPARTHLSKKIERA